MFKSFMYGLPTKFPWMYNYHFINHAEYCTLFSSNAFKLLNLYGKRTFGIQTKLIGSRTLISRFCFYPKLLDTRNTRTFNHWSFYKTQYHTLGMRHKYRSRTWFGSQKNPWEFSRNFSNSQKSYQQKNKTTAIYIIALVTVILGGSYAAVPLYRIFCQASGLGGTVQQVGASEKIKNMEAKKERLITVRFNADKSATMQWSFKPQQNQVKVYPGETALAFYTAKNPTDVAITGISTYNVIPFEAGQYFNKIQCFCFEEQRLNPHEQVDLPVFFYIDPEFSDDPSLYKVDTITLSYTFFQAKETQDLGIQ